MKFFYILFVMVALTLNLALYQYFRNPFHWPGQHQPGQIYVMHGNWEWPIPLEQSRERKQAEGLRRHK